METPATRRSNPAESVPDLRVEWHGEVRWVDALARQHDARAAVQAGAPGQLHLLTHPPTITIGRRGDPSNVLVADGCEVVQTDRGGDVTWHGPGQLVGYPIVHLERYRLGVRRYVERLADALASVLAEWGITATWDQEVPGLWVGSDKIAAFGIHVQRQVTTHGFALNVSPDFSGFSGIVACGLRDRGVTSMARLLGEAPPMAVLWPQVATAVRSALNSALRGRDMLGSDERGDRVV